MAAFTPMMQQYLDIKNQYKDCIMFYRVGDFYEMFFDDALTASKALEITLTGKDCGQEERAPMCGVPYHAYEVYANRLIEQGYKVAICEQVEDPKQAKGLVKRDVIQIITPGTNLSTQNLKEGQNNYIMSIYAFDNAYGIAVADITTGEARTCQVTSQEKCKDEINKYQPSEIICNETLLCQDWDWDYYRERLHITISAIDDWHFNEEQAANCLLKHFKVQSLEALGLKDRSLTVIASGALMEYLIETQKSSLDHMNRLELYAVDDYMILDSSTRRNLELTETLRDKEKRGSLLWVLDKTKTAMGARLLRTYIEQPLIRKDRIEERLDAIEQLNREAINREELREYLNPIYDLERLMTRISLKTANPRDLISFKTSLSYLPYIRQLLAGYPSGLLHQIYEDLDGLEDIHQLLEDSIIEDPPLQIKEGGIIKDGYLEHIDELKHAKTDGKQWLAELETKEREASGIKNLKIKYNKVFGYYFDVTNSYKELVPEHFIRKQTLANSERYTTEELDKLADTILGSEDKLCALEYETFCDIREKISGEIKRVQRTAHAVAMLDVMASLAYVTEQNHYIRPVMNEEGRLKIQGGRHPVVEKMIPNDLFIRNDTELDINENRIAIITGPNMAGKSTYMRQTALIVLLAQMGCYVPADQADIGIVDRIFTRVGASDDLASGQSTFMVEMSEVANILRNATVNSLLILDEIGRGTSTYDGLSIAWSVVEYISNFHRLGAKTLFATHYHELTELEGQLPGVHNYCIAVKEQGDDIVFLRKIMRGGADRSYGIQVAKLAGLPQDVIERANEILSELLDEHDLAGKGKKVTVAKPKKKEEPKQLSFFANPMEQEVVAEIQSLDLSNMTPMKALVYLSELQEKLTK
ncbi:dNA mismatch repair protein MutS [Clostridium sp. CAG:632]|nr:DNA mismatch repair protein MutS [Clostridium sp.]CCY58735.1 dNA mismatch repair protein MutS [Clostridium sp. CAG:632]